MWILKSKPFLAVLLLLCVCRPVLADDQGRQAIAFYKEAKQTALQADMARIEQRSEQAIELYERSLEQLGQVRKVFPDWSSMVLVDIQKSKCEDYLAQLRGQTGPVNGVFSEPAGPSERAKPVAQDKASTVTSEFADAGEQGEFDIVNLDPYVLKGRESEVSRYVRKADSLLFSGQFPSALRYYNEALNLRKDDSVILLNKGIALFKMEKIPEAISVFQRIINTKPQFAPAYSNLGDVYYAVGQFEASEKLYRQAIELDPYDLRSAVNLGVIYVQSGQINTAMDQFLRIVQRFPETPDAHYNLGVIYSDYLFDKDRAIHHFDQFVQISPHKEAVYEVEQWIASLKGARL